MRQWPAVVLAAFATASRQEQKAAPIDQLILTHGIEAGPVREAFERFEERLREFGEAGWTVAPPPHALQRVVHELAPTSAESPSRAIGPLGLLLYRATREAHATNGFAFDFQESVGLLRAFAFNDRLGVEATIALKLENDQGTGKEDEEEEEEFGKRIDDTLASMLEAFRREQAAAASPVETAFQESARWLGSEDPPEPGFRWSYVREGGLQLAQVDFVLANGSLAQAGLRAGDAIVAVNGAPTTSAAAFGRAIGGLAAGKALVLEVRRGGERTVVQGVVQRASEVVPAFEQGLLGLPLPPFRADVGGAAIDVGGATRTADASARAPLTIVPIFDPRQPDSLADAAELAWIRDHYGPGQVVIAGIATHGSEAQLRAVMKELAPGWPAAADPDGRLAEATRTVMLPALLLVDREGVVRFRRTRGGELQHALRTLLAAKR